MKHRISVDVVEGLNIDISLYPVTFSLLQLKWKLMDHLGMIELDSNQLLSCLKLFS